MVLQNKNVHSSSAIAGNDIADVLIHRRYLLKDRYGQILETPDQMYRRVAEAIAAVELQYGPSAQDVQRHTLLWYDLMVAGKFLPNTPTLVNAGKPDGQLSACFVLRIGDSIVEIHEALAHMAVIQKSGGGTGFAFDELRPSGDIVASSGGMTTGPLAFMEVFDVATGAIQQGSHRRGANMALMNMSHPDILTFINAKRNTNSLNNFNISVKVDDDFMHRLLHDKGAAHIVENPRDKKRYVIPRTVSPSSYRLQDLKPIEAGTEGCYTVGDVWDMVITNARETGEPGICFIDRVNEENPTPHMGRINATNPCGEQPLLNGEGCNLGSINVSKYVLPDQLQQAIIQAVRFLDNVIDANTWPLDHVKEISCGNRKIGLGIMGLADALVLLRMRYDSDGAVAFGRRFGEFIREHAHRASQELAKDRGCFPNWEGSIWQTEHNRPLRNATCTTIAPTGSISIIAKCSSGIEPIFKYAYKRRALDNSEFIQLHPLLERLGTEQGWLTEKVRAELMSGADPKDISRIPRSLSEILVTAHEIAPEWHIHMQAALQANIDNAVSKTVNLPADATVEDVNRVFRLAYERGCKGTTVYRDTSRPDQVLSEATAGGNSSPRSRPRATSGTTSKFRMGCGTLFVTVNKDEKGICEVFANLGKAGGCPSQSEATCRTVSAALRSGVDPNVMVDQLSGIRCLSAAVASKTNKEVDVRSCPDAIARAIKEAMGTPDREPVSSFREQCEECGRPSNARNVAGPCGVKRTA
ncbi:MAG: adenosylcobalamin-dependent ribonucleoside-diphosphate reductase [Planctomycetota bacterium]|jgi:ribonucleoside-diphosphate reductase alpha chain